ncbi:AURKA kinase, partial [Motacilla alba]|nr:AURKA kinase [Motacilla alba]
KVTSAIGDVPKRVPVSQHSAQSRSLASGAPARVLCPANFAQRVPVQPQKPLLSTQKPPNNPTAQQLRPKVPQQATVRPQAASKSSEKPAQAAAPAQNPEADSTSKQKTEEPKKKSEETKK